MFRDFGIHLVGHREWSLTMPEFSPGFHSQKIQAELPAADSLLLMLVNTRAYSFTPSGDLTLLSTEDRRVGETQELRGGVGQPLRRTTSEIDRHRYLAFGWTEEAWERGTGSGQISMINPELPEYPSIIDVTMSSARLAQTPVHCAHCHPPVKPVSASHDEHNGGEPVESDPVTMADADLPGPASWGGLWPHGF